MARSLNLASTEAQDSLQDRGGLVPPGEYPVVLKGYKSGQFDPSTPSFQAGFNSLSLHYKILEGDFKGQVVFDSSIVDSPRFAPSKKNPEGAINFRLVQFFSALGNEGEIELPDEPEGWGDYVGEEFGIRVIIEDYTSKEGVKGKRNKVTRTFPISEIVSARIPTKADAVEVSTKPKAGGSSTAQPDTGSVNGTLTF